MMPVSINKRGAKLGGDDSLVPQFKNQTAKQTLHCVMLSLHYTVPKSRETCMNDHPMITTVREHRTAAGLSQSELAARVGVSRQALSAIEAGRQVPSTLRSLHLAQALGCNVEDLFRIPGASVIDARLAPGQPDTRRVVLGRVQEERVAHPVDELTYAADGLIVGPGQAPGSASIQPFDESSDFDNTVLVAGCAPLLGIQADRLGRRYRDARASWIHANSRQALELLQEGLVHIAGVHLAASDNPNAHELAAREAVSNGRSTLVNLARWRQGLVVAPGNPLGVAAGPELLRPGLRFAIRDAGAAAQKLLERTLRSASAGRGGTLPIETAAYASDHAEVASLVAWGVADVGVAIESAALSRGLDFIPLSEERFDLVVPESVLGDGAVARFLDLIDQPAFRAEARELPGYDLSIAGHASTVEAA